MDFQSTEIEEIEKAIGKVKETISEDQSDLNELLDSYMKLLKISNQFCEHITAHNIKSSAFGVLMVVASDACKRPLKERFKIQEKLPYIEFIPEDMTENTLDAIRIWNDFMFYLPKSIRQVEELSQSMVDTEELLKNARPRNYEKNIELVRKSRNMLNMIVERFKRMEEDVKDYSNHLKKPQYTDHMMKISSIIESCGGYGIENMMSIFSITPINKYPSL